MYPKKFQKKQRQSKMRKILLFFVALHQKFFTLLDFGSCRYYPTCSQYAKVSLTYNSPLQALLQSILRILRCNQFFAGGIEYPKVDASILHLDLLQPRRQTLTKYDWRHTQAWLVFTANNKKQLYYISTFKETL